MLSVFNIVFIELEIDIIEQNRPFGSFHRILARLDESIKNFLLKQWHEVRVRKIMDFPKNYLDFEIPIIVEFRF